MAFVNEIITDMWVGARKQSDRVPCRDLSQVVNAIRKLDGDKYTEVILFGQGRTLIIGGGNKGRYVVVLTVGQDEAFQTLLNATPAVGDDIPVVVGGQEGLYPANQVVDLSAALQSSESFFESGEPAANMRWERS